MKRKLKLSKPLIISLVISLIVLSDQLSKSLSSSYFHTYCNEGIAFGVGLNSVPITLLVLTFVSYLVFREQNKSMVFAMSLIFAGGISNLIDRINIGCVRDFITIANLPSFNIADSAISVGAIIILYNIFLKRK